MERNNNSAKKQALIDAKVASPIEVGDRIYVFGKDIKDGGYWSEERKYSFTVQEILDINTVSVIENNGSRIPAKTKINVNDIFERWTYDVGVDPFHKSNRNVRFIAYNLQSILFKLGLNDGEGEKEEKYNTKNGTPIKNCNWNPYVINADGEKEYYQRPFVWSLSDKQLLLSSIYNGIDCGKILVREHDWNDIEKLSQTGETELAFHDIVDGKQRLNAIHEFICGGYPDVHGNYYADLSNKAQRYLTDNQLFAFGEMGVETKDSDVIEQFLKLNFTGVPQSAEHIEFVKSIHDKM